MLFNQNILKHILKTDLAEELLWWLNKENYHYPIWEVTEKIEGTENSFYLYSVDKFEIIKPTCIDIKEFFAVKNKNTQSIELRVNIKFITRCYYTNKDDKKTILDVNDNAEFWICFDFNSRWHKKFKNFRMEYIRWS